MPNNQKPLLRIAMIMAMTMSGCANGRAARAPTLASQPATPASASTSESTPAASAVPPLVVQGQSAGDEHVEPISGQAETAPDATRMAESGLEPEQTPGDPSSV